MPFSDKIKKARIDKGISQPEIADYFGFTPQFVSNMEQGKAYPPASCFSKLMKKLDLEVKYMFYLMLEEMLDKREAQIKKAYKMELV